MTSSLDPSFLTGARSAKQFPADEGAEVAFSGRSNSGKSSAINAITGHTRIARTSKTPGRTREINFFEVGPNQRLVDLPGYGYAKVAAKLRDQWSATLEQYFRRRRSLRGLFVTVDIRRGLGELDQVMLSLSAAAGVPAAVLLTKADKLSRSAAAARLRDIDAVLEEPVPVLLFSAPGRQGVEAARERLVGWLGGVPPE
ncbi:MAG TPA: ribosome biogenesis GTP-binding protein YihA/YsxC [Gammaproteobacteria bacterium]|nr:ribosome biogenesis GTP-binding protein YihA/YsxC [Gammaproteobacteria bacterium]